MQEPTGKTNIADLIREKREAAKMSQEELALKVGTNQQTIQKIEGKITKNSGFLPKILKVLDISMDYIASLPTAVRNSHIGPRDNVVDFHPGTIMHGPANLPVHGAAQGGKGAVIVSTDPIEYVARPQPLLSVKDAYGIIIVEDSMAPEFEPGNIALVHPHLPPQAGSTCIFYSEQDDGTTIAIVKRLRRATADAWHVRQWNPPEGEKQDFVLKRSEWQTCHVTVGRYDGRR